MNDFTKEELRRIKDILDKHDFREPVIINKLLVLIDNYCEHEFKSCLQDVIAYQCDDCFEVFNDE